MKEFQEALAEWIHRQDPKKWIHTESIQNITFAAEYIEGCSTCGSSPDSIIEFTYIGSDGRPVWNMDTKIYLTNKDVAEFLSEITTIIKELNVSNSNNTVSPNV